MGDTGWLSGILSARPAACAASHGHGPDSRAMVNQRVLTAAPIARLISAQGRIVPLRRFDSAV